MLKINFFRKDITPAVKTLLAGYGRDVKSVGIHDELFMSGLPLEKDKNKALLVSLDLLGLEDYHIAQLKDILAGRTGIKSADIVLTCTHTHSGPHSRWHPVHGIDEKYMELLFKAANTIDESIFENMREVELYHYSSAVCKNVNRRIIFSDNSCRYLPQAKEYEPMAKGITDPELGILYFADPKDNMPVATFVNYAAHPLTCQTGGRSSRMITSDYPGVLRKVVEKELGGFCIFATGACGDLHPEGFGSGFEQTQKLGKELGIEVCKHYFDVLRSPDKYKVVNADIKVHSASFKVEFRSDDYLDQRQPQYAQASYAELDLDFLTIGDICMVGVPGEILAEPGLEIKWHSPFKKTFILYNSTAYISYLPHGNAYVSGGYEADTAHVSRLSSFELVCTAIRKMNEIAEK